jgi:dimethylamine--corrinoid protein Co-methyltransferase
VPSVERRIQTRLGDGSVVEMTPSEIRADVEDAVALAVRRAKVAPLSQGEIDHLVDIFSSTARVVGVDPGCEVVLTYDGSGNADAGGRVDELLGYQNHKGSDSLELWNMDYSYKAVKSVLSHEAHLMRMAQANLTVPLQYGAMPNLGLYSRPDGPSPNWSELLPLGRIDEAREAQEEAIGHAVDDMVFVADGMWQAGADGLDFDTTAAAGDGDFLATLRAVEAVRARYPDLSIEVGMAAEFVLGMHGELTYDDVRLAGLWPRDQVKVAARAGATIFGPAVNVNTRRSVAWNTARAVAICKPCCEEAAIPVHPNVGMGVCGVPMTPYPPIDAVSRVSKALVELLRLDGL